MKTIKNFISQNSFLVLAIIFFFVFNFNYIFMGALLKGDDASSLYYPVIYYLKTNIEQGNFPFYTEKMFAGYPIYQNSEAAYLNPLRLLLTYLLPFEKVLPVEYSIFFIAGLIGYFYFLREKKISDSAIFFSHFIFFYNLQFTARFVHQQLIFSVLLLPLLIYLTELFFNESNQRKKKFSLILSSIVVTCALLYGSYPGVFLLLLGQFIYVITNILNKQNIKFIFIFYTFFVTLFLSFSFYSLYPTYSLFKESSRNLDELSVSKGSISPTLLLANFLTPTPLGTYQNFLGEKFNSSWIWHEIHTYQGLSFFIISILGFIYLKNTNFKRFFIVTFSFFIILATLKYSNFVYLFDFPPFSFFRYHIRFGAIFSFSLAILGASTFHKFIHEYERNEFKKMLLNALYLFIPAVLFIYIIFYSYNSYENQALLTHFKNAIISNTIPNFRESLVTPLFLFLVIILYKYSHRKSLLVVIPMIAVIEFMIQVNSIYTETLVYKNLINAEITKITNFYEGKRVIFDNKIYGNQTLYYKNWNIYGYSAYDQNTYKEYLESNGLNVRRYKEKNYFLTEKLRVYRAIDENYNIHGVSTGQFFALINENSDYFDLDYRTLSLNENHKFYDVMLDNDSRVKTFIKFDKNIEVYVNKERVEFPRVNEIFYELDLRKGSNTIEFIYQPRELYLGFVIGLMLSIFTLLIFRKIEFRN